jgi:hypothetical protein
MLETLETIDYDPSECVCPDNGAKVATSPMCLETHQRHRLLPSVTEMDSTLCILRFVLFSPICSDPVPHWSSATSSHPLPYSWYHPISILLLPLHPCRLDVPILYRMMIVGAFGPVLPVVCVPCPRHQSDPMQSDRIAAIMRLSILPCFHSHPLARVSSKPRRLPLGFEIPRVLGRRSLRWYLQHRDAEP